MRKMKILVALALASAPAAAFASGGGLGDLLSVAPGSILWTILTFLILLVVLWKFAWGPIIKGLEAREHKINGAIDQAQKDREDAARLLRDYEEKLKKLSEEVNERLAKADKQATERIEKATEEAREKSEQMLERAKEEIEAHRERVAKDLRSELVNLAAEVASSAIGESFTREDQMRAIKKRLEQLEAQS